MTRFVFISWHNDPVYLADTSEKIDRKMAAIIDSEWFSSVRLTVCPSVSRRFTFSLSYPEPLGQFQPNLAQRIIGWRGFKFVQIMDPVPFQGEKLKNILLNNHLASFNQTWNKVSLGDGHSSLFRWRAAPFYRVEKYEIAKIYWQNLWNTISTKLGTKNYWVKGIQVCSNNGPRPVPRWDKNEIAKIHERN